MTTSRYSLLSSTQDGCLMWGTRVVIPKAGREQVLKLLQEGHPGILRMKRIARGMVWWPNIDANIERKVQDCEPCQLTQKSPATAPLHPWEWSNRPWSRIHIDHAGPFMGKTFLVLVDAHSKWMDAHIVPLTTLQMSSPYSGLPLPVHLRFLMQTTTRMTQARTGHQTYDCVAQIDFDNLQTQLLDRNRLQTKKGGM